ncbi:hypothetical protein SLOPH_1748 [Spraguea lophii 42_110]|uniref:General transcription and DNA repair factor IIH subunit TFB4 n=1 Tax=Spraguea lophii (strain 42_110) TaxID=1358809 RepID=S7XPB5_SPRLO|nr:hypothetical protein SLOPH_1748 [Spraguea lophii 42_110]
MLISIITDSKSFLPAIDIFSNIYLSLDDNNSINLIERKISSYILSTTIIKHHKNGGQIILVSNENINKKEYYNFLKLSFAAHKLKISINSISNNLMVKMLSYNTKSKNLPLKSFNVLTQLLNILIQKENDFPEYYPSKCICHNKNILYGLVCPVCLTIYCQFVPICKKCKIKIKIK